MLLYFLLESSSKQILRKMSNQSFVNSSVKNITTTIRPLLAPNSSIDAIYYVGYVACIFGVLTNILNILVFLHPKLKDSTYKFMLADSVVDMAFLLISGISIALGCGNACLPNYNTYIGQIFSVWFVNYFSRALAVLGILIEIFVSFQRLMLIKKQEISQRCLSYQSSCNINSYFVHLLFARFFQHPDCTSIFSISVHHKFNPN